MSRVRADATQLGREDGGDPAAVGRRRRRPSSSPYHGSRGEANVERGGAEKDRGSPAKTLGTGQSEAGGTETHHERRGAEKDFRDAAEALGSSKEGTSKGRYKTSAEKGADRKSGPENGQSGIISLDCNHQASSAVKS